MSEGRERRARALLRLLLVGYPGPFRRRHGAAMTATLLEEWRAADGRPGGRAGFWIRTAWSLAREGLAERLRPAPMSRRTGDPLTSTRHEGSMSAFLTDLSRASRALLRSPGFTLLVVLTLALGIGANVAIVSLIDAVVLRPLPVSEPDRLVRVHEAVNERSLRGGMSYSVYLEVAENVRQVESMTAHAAQEAELRFEDRAVSVRVGLVSGTHFDVLGVPAALGRTLVPDDEAGWGRETVAVLSWTLFEREFGGDPGVVGSSIDLGQGVFTVVGVLPPRFQGVSLTSSTDVWVPVTTGGHVVGEGGMFGMEEILTTPVAQMFEVYARLPAGVGLEAATPDLNRVRTALQAETADNVAEPMSLVPLREAAAPASRSELIRFLALLTGVVGLTLLVACVNVANLLVVRARRRARDLAVRAALGAGRGRLFRELGLEALLLGLLAGLAAVLTARATVALLTGFTLPGGIAVERAGLEIGWGALALAGALGLGSALAFGMIPAWRASRAGALAGLRTREGGRTRRCGWWMLLAAQAGLSVVLLVGAALFGRTLQEALRTDPGFDAEGVAAAMVRLRPHGVAMAEAAVTVDRMIEAAERSPEVQVAAFATHVPVGPRHVSLPFMPDEDEDAAVGVPINIVTPGYFEALGIPLLAGRLFDERDVADGERVILVNEAAARQLWGTENPVGRLGRITFNREPSTVVGVVGQTLYHDLTTREEPYVYYPLTQLTGPAMDRAHLIARATPGGRPPVDVVRSALREVDPLLPVQQLRAVERQIDQVMAAQRFGATLLGLFSVLALLIASIGIYGVAAWAVAARRREIGIRLALGARAVVVIRGVLGLTASATAAGALAGLVAAGALAGLLEAFLYEVTPLDPGAFAAALVALAVAAALATWIPARRAVRVDPAETMRSE